MTKLAPTTKLPPHTVVSVPGYPRCIVIPTILRGYVRVCTLCRAGGPESGFDTYVRPWEVTIIESNPIENRKSEIGNVVLNA